MQPRVQARRRAGFTLIETIVTVGLLAVLAAFVVPTVIQKAGAGDPVKVQNDLNAVGTGLQTFFSDTKAGYPNQIWQLTSRPSSGNRLVDSITTLTTGQVAAWNGPYLALTIGATALDSVPTGYTAYLLNYLQRYDITHNAGELSGGTSTGTGTGFGTFNDTTGTLFVAVRIDGLTTLQAATINTIIDGSNDVNVATGSTGAGANVTGRFRFDAPAGSSSVVTAYYMVVPITQ